MAEIFTFGRIRYDVDRALEVIQENAGDEAKVRLATLPTDDLMTYLCIGLVRADEDHAKTVDIDKPGIAVMTKNGALLIDGWHRVLRRHQLGLDEIDCYVIMDFDLVEAVVLDRLQPKNRKAVAI